jgi:hypothetical protein
MEDAGISVGTCAIYEQLWEDAYRFHDITLTHTRGVCTLMLRGDVVVPWWEARNADSPALLRWNAEDPCCSRSTGLHLKGRYSPSDAFLMLDKSSGLSQCAHVLYTFYGH